MDYKAWLRRIDELHADTQLSLRQFIEAERTIVDDADLSIYDKGACLLMLSEHHLFAGRADVPLAQHAAMLGIEFEAPNLPDLTEEKARILLAEVSQILEEAERQVA